MLSRLTSFALMNLAVGTVMAAEYSLPARIRVLPVAFVPAGEKACPHMVPYQESSAVAQAPLKPDAKKGGN